VLVNRVGDGMLVWGLVAAVWGTGGIASLGALQATSGAAPLLCLGMLFATMGKSAQVGMHVWLGDAMEGPTPVSALLHAATLVAAGVYVTARLTTC